MIALATIPFIMAVCEVIDFIEFRNWEIQL